MLLFSIGESAALYWDRHGNISGVRLRRERYGLVIAGAVYRPASIDAEMFSVALADAHERLSTLSEGLLLLGGHLPGSVCFELGMPKMPPGEIGTSLAFELPRRQPFPAQELCSQHRICGEMQQGASNLWRVRVYAATRKEWQQLVGEIEAAGLHPDMVTSPFMVSALDTGTFELRGIEEAYALVRNEEASLARMLPEAELPSAGDAWEKKCSTMPGYDILRKALPPEERERATEIFLPALLLAEYGHSPNFSKDLKTALPLPEKFRPKRCRGLKTLCLMAGACALLLGLAYAGRVAWNAHSRISALESERMKIAAALEKIKADNAKNKHLDLAIKSLAEVQPANQALLQSLQHIAQNLPDSMWVSDFNCSPERIDLTVKTSGEVSDSDLTALSKTTLFTIDNSNKRRNRDGSTDIFMRLLYTSPKEEEAPAAGSPQKAAPQKTTPSSKWRRSNG